MKNIFCCFTLVGLVWSQSAGMFANSGESLISIEGQYDSEDFDGGSLTTTSVGGVYVLNGNLEIVVNYDMGKATYDNNNPPDVDVDRLSFGGYYHMKENETLPFSVKIGGWYGTAQASADWLDDAGLEIETNASGIGGGVYKTIYQKDAMTIMGFFNFQSITTEATISDSYDSIKEDDEYNSTSFGLAVRNGNLFIKPSIGRVDGESKFNITFGFLLPQ